MDDDEVVDELDALITSKGMLLEPYKRELSDLVKNCDTANNNTIGKERESNQLGMLSSSSSSSLSSLGY